MKNTRFLLFLLALPLVLLPGLFAEPEATAQELVKCTCRQGNACYHFLNSPVDPPNDPCSCPRCVLAPGRCEKIAPEGWSLLCAGNKRMECFLRRHAFSWKLSCSARLSGECDCSTDNPAACPNCGRDGNWDQDGLDVIRRQVEVESKLLGDPRRFIVVKSPHFYLVTDIRSLKILTQDGAPRVMGMHELAHVFIQRAEIAYQDFVRYFGARVSLPRPLAIYLLDKSRTMEDVQAAYFGNPRTNILYGGGATRIAGGYPFNGFSTSLQKSGDDHGLHLQVRHSIGHILLSCWVQVNGQDKHLPRWTYAGAGHWLARLPEKFRESATFCADEGTPIQNNGRNWRQRILKIAGSAKSAPVQAIFDVNALSGLDLDMHVTAWSWFDVFLEEDRERFVAFLAKLRNAEDPRKALRETMGTTPEEFHERWKERVLGKRPSVAPTAAELDETSPEAPGAKERAGIRSETDPQILAAKIRSLQAVNDRLTAATVVPMLRTDSELVRETIVLVLGRTTSEEVKEWLRTEGLSGSSGVVRAYVARALGDAGDKAAGPELAKYLTDGFWLTRAHAARAIGLVGYEPAKETLKKLVDDSSQKVRIAAMDALGRLGERAGSAWAPVADQLGASAWQVRSAAAACLGELGRMEAVDPLIARMEIETGRIRLDIRESLKTLTRDDLGNVPENWRKWWDKEKERAGGLPQRGEKPKEPPKGEHVYADEPTYYGMTVFSQGVGYVLDVSSSMLSTIRIDPEWLKKQRRKYPPEATKFDLAREEIAASLATLDPRVRFNLYFFRSTAFSWKSGLTPVGGAVDSAVSRLANERPKDGGAAGSQQTNYVDVFRLVLGVKPGEDLQGQFSDTPDTIYFLTDGEPTTGDITDVDVLISWFSELNRFARVKVNVITFGSLGVEVDFLRRLATQNGGTFVQVPEAR